MTIPILNLPSFAKINRSLRVLGKRSDGYHEVCTVMQTISLCDQLIFELIDEDRIVVICDDPAVPTNETNLVTRAAIALRQRMATPLGVRVVLLKRIPMQAGLGGGSSNAAVTLLALNELWSAGLEHDELRALGSKLGADVPFFLMGGRVLAEGVGTRLTALPDIGNEPLVVILPNARVATKRAYEALNAPSLTTSNPISILASSFTTPDPGECDQWPPQNDFEDVIFEIEPEIRRAKQALLESGARAALLAGSGSGVFGIFESREARRVSLEKLSCEEGWRIFSCETVSRAGYVQALGSLGSRSYALPKHGLDTGA